ncbi:MAG: glycosyltransferase [Candidatus Electrothrix sp. LOE2]|nr:glycosyltransferase [Candidatus Electrothrix sp. LOE2]
MIENKNIGVLYLSYDGMLEPLGQSQVLAYLERLAEKHKIFLISFEKVSDWQEIEKREALRRRIKKAGITWMPLRYHKRFSALSTAFDIAQGTVIGTWIVFRHRIQIVHARSYVSSVIALVLKKLFRLKYIFDMRGFWADERVDGGLWPKNCQVYHTAKWFEKQFLLSADCVVSLTHVAVSEMKTFSYLQNRMPRFDIITTCTALELFKRVEPEEAEKNNWPFILGYVGSVGTWYLFDEALKFFKRLQHRIPSAVLHILNRGDHNYIRERISAADLSAESFWLDIADHAGVSGAMQRMDVGIFFYKPAYSKLATAPTKLGEFLGCGVPCISNIGVGDIQGILEGERVGVVLEDFSDRETDLGVKRLIDLTNEPDIQSRCRQAAEKYFSLENGVKVYDRIYRDLLNS